MLRWSGISPDKILRNKKLCGSWGWHEACRPPASAGLQALFLTSVKIKRLTSEKMHIFVQQKK
jgi:hypothetical protein